MIAESIRSGVRAMRRKVVYRDFQRAVHYERTSLDRHTAALLLTCWRGPPALTVLSDRTVCEVMAEWDEQKKIWDADIASIACRPFTIGDFVTYLLCEQERKDGRFLREALFEYQVIEVQRHMDIIMQETERDLQLAGFLAATNEQIERRAMRAIQSI